jgi:hypothetical protein
MSEVCKMCASMWSTYSCRLPLTLLLTLTGLRPKLAVGEAHSFPDQQFFRLLPSLSFP